MNLKEGLKKLKDLLQKQEVNEFEANLEDHPIKEGDIYRLHFVGYYNSSYIEPHKTCIDWWCKPFMFPNGMSREDSFKVLSYLTDYIEKTAHLKEASLESVKTLDSILNLERLGFTRITYQVENDMLIDLFTIGGRIRRFLSSEYYPKYFEWYTPNISKEEVEEIYKRLDMEFIPPIFNPDIQEEKPKTFTKQ